MILSYDHLHYHYQSGISVDFEKVEFLKFFGGQWNKETKNYLRSSLFFVDMFVKYSTNFILWKVMLQKKTKEDYLCDKQLICVCFNKYKTVFVL